MGLKVCGGQSKCQDILIKTFVIADGFLLLLLFWNMCSYFEVSKTPNVTHRDRAPVAVTSWFVLLFVCFTVLITPCFVVFGTVASMWFCEKYMLKNHICWQWSLPLGDDCYWFRSSCPYYSMYSLTVLATMLSNNISLMIASWTLLIPQCGNCCVPGWIRWWITIKMLNVVVRGQFCRSWFS